MLLQLIETSGKRWKLIAEALGNSNPRTPAMVRNRYLRIERGRWLTEQGMSKNRCGQCGQLKRGHVCQAPRAFVNPDVSSQAEGHALARRQQFDGEAIPCSPGGAGSKLALGAPPLTFTSYGDTDTTLALASPDGTPGRTPHSLVGICGTAGAGTAGTLGPPGLRSQSSFDMLLRASEMRSGNPNDGVQPPMLADTPSVVPGELPFASQKADTLPDASTLTPADMAGPPTCGTKELSAVGFGSFKAPAAALPPTKPRREKPDPSTPDASNDSSESVSSCVSVDV